MKKLIITLLFSSFTFANVANAETCNSDYCDAKLKVLYTHSNGNVYVIPDSSQLSNLGCKILQGGILLRSDHVRYSEVYSSLLSSYMADMKLRLRVKDTPTTTDACILEYIQLRRDI
jgi:hypothetical protein